MQLITLIAACLLVVGALAWEKDLTAATIQPKLLKLDRDVTLTLTQTKTTTDAASCSTSTSSVPTSTPTSAYTVTAARSGSPLQYMSFNAAGLALFIGGTTSVYCPELVRQAGVCTNLNVTAFSDLCAMACT